MTHNLFTQLQITKQNINHTYGTVIHHDTVTIMTRVLV